MLSHVVLMKAGCFLDIGHRRQECFQVNLEVWLWHTQSLLKSPQFFGRLFNSNLGYVAMSVMSRSDYPGWLGL